MVHADTDMEKPHVDPHNTFGVAPEVIGISDQLKIQFILPLLVAVCRGEWVLQPVIVTGPRDSCEGTQRLYGKLIAVFINSIFDQLELSARIKRSCFFSC